MLCMLKKSGLSARELFKRGVGITYDDFTTLNTTFSDITREQVDLTSDLGKGVVLKIPIIAAPMDTVANARLCIALALQGGIGGLHYNHRDSSGNVVVNPQIEEIKAVKRYQNGFVDNPVSVSPDMRIQEVIELGIKRKVGDSNLTTFPVTDNGQSNGKLVGLLTKRDYWNGYKTHLSVGERMIPLRKLVTVDSSVTLDRAREEMWKHHIDTLPVVDKDGRLRYIVTRSDIAKLAEFPNSTRDEQNRLRVLFAVSTWKKDYERLERGFDAGADGVIIDSSQGFTRHEKEMIDYIKRKYGDKLLIGGNVSTKEAALFLDRNKIDAYRCGQGSGSICTTAGQIGVSRAGATAVYECALALKGKRLKTLADGGIKQPGDISKALFLGASAVMLGKMLAGTDEAPGETQIDPSSGLLVKIYRGMGSAEANAGSMRGYTKLPEGVSGRVAYRGKLGDWIPKVMDGVRHAFEIHNFRSIDEAHEALYSRKLRFERRTEGSLRESLPTV